MEKENILYLSAIIRLIVITYYSLYRPSCNLEVKWHKPCEEKTYTNEKFEKPTTMSMKHKPKTKINNSFSFFSTGNGNKHEEGRHTI